MKSRRGALWVLFLMVFLSLIACGKNNKWQEQYDLGVRYLSEGNYQEAIIAFTAAIEIDPKQPQPYVGRGDAYIGSGETEENLRIALADYEAATALDETNAGAWLGMADVYVRQGRYDEALELLESIVDMVSDSSRVRDRIQAMQSGTFSDSKGKTRKSVKIEDGQVTEYWLYKYDEKGNNIQVLNYDADDTLDNIEDYEFDEQGMEIKMTRTYVKNGSTTVELYEYDSIGRRIKETRTSESNDVITTFISYDDMNRTETRDQYANDGNLIHRFVVEYDENGISKKANNYKMDKDGKLYLDYYVVYIWNDDGSYGGYEIFHVAE